MQTVYVKAKRAEILKLIQAIPTACRGNVSEANAAARALMVRVGMVALGRISTAFIQKSNGGADDTGLQWKPLKPETVAYSRRHPGVLYPGHARAPYAPSWMLTAAQRTRWWQLYRNFGGTRPAGRAYHARPRGDGGWAAARAWNVIKAEGAKTLLIVYGNAPHEILRNTGLLLNSLSPGVNVPEQIFNVENAKVTVGTKRKWAALHHEGGKNMPQRRLWPKPSNWTSAWWLDCLEELRKGSIEVSQAMLRRFQ